MPPILLDDRQRFAWLKLIRSERVGPATFHGLIQHAGSAEAALAALPDLARRGGSRRIRIAGDAEIEAEFRAAERAGARFVAVGEAGYPAALRAIDAPPPLLALRGATEPGRRPMVAIVGARNASLAGRKIAGQIARDLGAAGFVIVSGLARGIDAAAHEASLSTGTLAVLAGGLDRIYPPEHVPLAARIVAEGGALISEMPFGWEPRAQDFPRRNRLVSGSALGVLVVEAAARSGTLHTARFALDQGRELFAVPGSPLDPRAEGTNKLLKQGATLATEAADVIEALGPLIGVEPKAPALAEAPVPAAPTEAPDDLRGALVAALGPTPVAVDDLARMLGASARELQVALLELDLAGRIERHGQGRVSLVA